jgi:hypothetical protein
MSYLTQDDLNNFGPEILDVIQRGSRQAMAPILDRLEERNELLNDRLAQVTQDNLHRQVVAAVPRWSEINASPAWLAWLQAVDPLNGITRQQLLNRAVQEGRASSVIALFRDFQKEAAAGQPAQQSGQPGRITPSYWPAPSSRGRVYSRQEILDQAGRRRRNEINDADWAKWEVELCRASREGRIAGGLNPQTGCQY